MLGHNHKMTTIGTWQENKQIGWLLVLKKKDLTLRPRCTGVYPIFLQQSKSVDGLLFAHRSNQPNHQRCAALLTHRLQQLVALWLLKIIFKNALYKKEANYKALTSLQREMKPTVGAWTKCEICALRGTSLVYFLSLPLPISLRTRFDVLH